VSDRQVPVVAVPWGEQLQLPLQGLGKPANRSAGQPLSWPVVQPFNWPGIQPFSWLVVHLSAGRLGDKKFSTPFAQPAGCSNHSATWTSNQTANSLANQPVVPTSKQAGCLPGVLARTASQLASPTGHRGTKHPITNLQPGSMGHLTTEVPATESNQPANQPTNQSASQP